MRPNLRILTLAALLCFVTVLAIGCASFEDPQAEHFAAGRHTDGLMEVLTSFPQHATLDSYFSPWTTVRLPTQ
jgi:hypothetical protein